MSQVDPGSHVFVLGQVSADGRLVRVAPGVEVGAGSVEIVSVVPPVEEAFPLVMFFGSEIEREMFAAKVESGIR